MADDGVKRLHDPIALQTQAGRDPTAFRTPRLSAVRSANALPHEVLTFSRAMASKSR